MNLLILGGTSDAIRLCKLLLAQHNIIYSVKGITQAPKLDCKIRMGGFGGVEGLVDFLAKNKIDCLLDATHPYAIKISKNAIFAANYCALPCYHYLRPAWQQQANDAWILFDSMADLSLYLQKKANQKLRLLFTIGQLSKDFINKKSPQHDYIVRSVVDNKIQNVTKIISKGSFSLEQERELFENYQIDALVSKNSGGHNVDAKIQIAREMRLPVYLLKRPKFESNHPIFSSINEMILKLF